MVEKINLYFMNVIQNFSDSYLRTFHANGYGVHPPVKTTSRIDQSTVFVGSTISVFKSILNNIPDTGLIISQPSIRTHNEKKLFTSEDINYSSFFHLIGGIYQYNDIQELIKIVQDITNFFLQNIDTQKYNFLAKVSTQDEDLIESLRKNNINLELDSNKGSYYKWKYGMDNVVGNGLTFAIRDKGNMQEDKEDIGNIIVMKNSSTSKNIAIQWGFGIETTLSRMSTYKNPLFTTLIHSFLYEFQKQKDYVRFLDSLNISIHCLAEDVSLNNGDVGRHLKRYMKFVTYFCYVHSINIGYLFRCINDYCRSYGYQNSEYILENLRKIFYMEYKKYDIFVKFIQQGKNKQFIREIFANNNVGPREQIVSKFGISENIIRQFL